MNLQPGACVYRKTVNGAKRGNYRARYIDADGKKQDHVLVLSNGCPVRDLGIAQSELRAILKRVTREAAGLIDPAVKNAGLSLRIILAGYLRDMRHRHRDCRHVRSNARCVKAMLRMGSMSRLADLTTANANKALGVVADRGLSPRTINWYRGWAYALGQWCVRRDLLPGNPVARIARWQQSTDIRIRRRALTFEEATRLLNAAAPNRRAFYATQLWTGLRCAETTALEWADLNLDDDRPCIRLRAETTKAGRADELPLHPSLRDLLRDMRDGSTGAVFKTTPVLRSFKLDLQAAGIPFADAQGRTVDRHALRTTFLYLAGRLRRPGST